MLLPDQLSLKQWARFLARKEPNGEITSSLENELLSSLIGAVQINDPRQNSKDKEDILIAWIDGEKNDGWESMDEVDRAIARDEELAREWEPKYIAHYENSDKVVVNGDDLKKFILADSKYKPRIIIKKACDSIPPARIDTPKRPSGQPKFDPGKKKRLKIEILEMLNKNPYLKNEKIIYSPKITKILNSTLNKEPSKDMSKEDYKKEYGMAPSGIENIIREVKKERDAEKTSP